MSPTQPPETGADYRAAYERLSATPAPSWLASLRKAALARFQTLGFPSTHEEAWKYTNTESIAKGGFVPVDPGAKPRVTTSDVAAVAYAGLRAHQLVFVDSTYRAELSTLLELPVGVRAQSLASALAKNPELLEPHLAQVGSFETNPFVALNTAPFHDGALIEIPRNLVLEPPLHVVFLSSGGAAPRASFPRVLIKAGPRSQATVVETYATLGTGPHFASAVTELVAEEGSVVRHLKVQRDAETASHVQTIEIEQGRASNVTSTNLSLGSRLARTDINARFEGEGGELTLNGLYVTRGTQHVDTHTAIDHAYPRCQSREFYKGILDGTSRGVFYGKINVRKDAQKTNSLQTNKNLLLSGGALVDSIPALEIHADDVKCGHGSTIGQLDKDSLFYLRSRGLDDPTARSLLTFAFARDILSTIPLEPVRVALEEQLLERLPAGRAVKEALA